MDIRIVREYLDKYRGGTEIMCPYDILPLYPNMTNDDIIYLYCLACNYKVNVGYNLYDKMKRAIGGTN